jgi:sulfur carrier protein
MQLLINGQPRAFAELTEASSVLDLLTLLGLKGDRVALERNADIVPRSSWAETRLAENDKIEIVHFVGGGC